MKKILILAATATFALSACAEEASAPVTDDNLPAEGLPTEAVPQTMPEGEVQDESADTQYDQKLSDEEANAALDALDAEEAEAGADTTE